MVSLPKEPLMPDELPSGDKAVYVFIEMIALGFVLYAIEEGFRTARLGQRSQSHQCALLRASGSASNGRY